MDGSQAKLTRTQSSLLRASPTIRSSIHSLSSIVDIDDGDYNYSSDEDKKAAATSASHHHYHHHNTHLNHHRVVSLLAVGSVTLVLTFIYLNTPEITTSENLLLLLIFIAVALFYLSKNRDLIITGTKSYCYRYRYGSNHHSSHKNNTHPVKWYIGEDYLPQPHHQQQGCVGGGSPKVKVKQEVVLEGVEFYTNGDFYEGEFYRGKSNGSGVYNYTHSGGNGNGNGRFEGEWVEGRYEGYGIESWAKGSRYRGMYRGGLRHGFGVYRFYTGDTYAGEWCNGQYHGVGVQSCSDGSCYVGVFKCGVKHGLGCYHFRNGDRYAGEYFGDKIHGFGVYHFANGHCYEGSWHEGRKQGYGMYTFRSGEAKCGEWDCGSLKTSLPPLTDTVLRAVQAARKAAENAINLRRVDDQVNKAVMGANRAATAARVAAVKAVQNRMDGKFYDTSI